MGPSHIGRMSLVFKNKLLAILSAADRAAVSPFLRRRDFERFEVIEELEKPVLSALFIEEGVLSVLAMHRPGYDVAVAMIGMEGMTGTSLINGLFEAPLPVEAVTGGWGYEIRHEDFQVLLSRNSSIHDRLIRYREWQLIQMAMMALSGRQAHMEQNLARVILMLHDRTDGDVLHITHEELARHLSVRRPGISAALPILEGEKMIRSTRGSLEVLDRPALEDFAGIFYGAAEDAWFRMLGKVSARSEAAE